MEGLYKNKLAAEPETPFPFWARIWPSSVALAVFLQNEPHWIENKLVVEFAAGLGLPSLAIAHIALSIWCSDWIPESVEAMKKSFALHGFTNTETVLFDWSKTQSYPSTEVVLLSDVHYDPASFPYLERLFGFYIQQGSTIIISTPQRLMAKPFLDQILPFCILQKEVQIEENGIYTTISIFVLRSKK